MVPDNRGPLSYSVDAEQGPVRLRYFTPPEKIRPYFGSLYIFSVAADHYADVTRADVAQLRLMLKGEGRYHFQDGSVQQPPAVGLIGPTLGATRFELDAPTRLVGVSLLPAGWRCMAAMPTRWRTGCAIWRRNGTTAFSTCSPSCSAWTMATPWPRSPGPSSPNASSRFPKRPGRSCGRSTAG
ncbi:hypothetical protein ACFSUK_19680 [Sphingobium scionense]